MTTSGCRVFRRWSSSILVAASALLATYYGDSSALVRRYVRETGNRWVIAVTDPPAGNTVLTALVTGAEIVAAIARRARGGSITAPAATAAIGRFKLEFRTRFQIVSVTDDILDVDAMIL